MADAQNISSNERLVTYIDQFFKERDWDKFHSPKNLVMSLASEVGELLDLFRWMSEEKSFCPESDTLQDIRDEIGDVFMSILYLAHKLNINPIEATVQKLEKMRLKYPTEQCKGKCLKHTEYVDTP